MTQLRHWAAPSGTVGQSRYGRKIETLRNLSLSSEATSVWFEEQLAMLERDSPNCCGLFLFTSRGIRRRQS
jgi:hypothetical protein